jgi:hypothetical protein
MVASTLMPGDAGVGVEFAVKRGSAYRKKRAPRITASMIPIITLRPPILSSEVVAGVVTTVAIRVHLLSLKD